MKRLAILTLAFTCALPCAAMNLTEHGQANCAIVIPDDALELHRYPARELQHFLQAVSGAEIPVVAESQCPDDVPHRVFVGPTDAALEAGIDAEALEPEAIRILTAGGDLFLLGRDRPAYGERDDPMHFYSQTGTLFAVYDFLQDQLGVRWLWPGQTGTVIPHSPTVTVGELDIHEVPQIKQRKLRAGIRSTFLERIEQSTGPLDREIASRLAHDEAVWKRRMRMGVSLRINYGHAFTRWWEQYGEEHPEFFALNEDGERAPWGPPDRIKMCVSQPALWDFIVERWKERWQQDPVANRTLNACENDGGGFCQCEACRAWDVEDYVEQTPEGPRVILSDRYAKFWNEVAKRVAQVDPDAYVAVYAYSRYRFPPRETRLEPNIIVGFVPAVGYPNTGESSEQFREDWMAWHRQATKLFLRPNWLGGLHAVPRAPLHRMADDFRFAAANGMIGTDYDSLSGQWCIQGPVYYLLARLHWDTTASTEQLLGEYYAAFGAAAPTVREYFEYWNRYAREEWPRWRDEMYELGYRNMARGGERVIPYVYDREAFAPALDMLMEARRMALGEPEIVQRRVNDLLRALRHAQMTARAIAATEAINSGTGDLAANIDVIRRMHRYRMDIGRDNVINPYWAMWRDTKYGDYAGYKLVRDIGDRSAVVLLDRDWRFRFDPDEVGEDEGWQSLHGAAEGWTKIRTDRFWEDQRQGREWEDQHGDDYDGLGWYRTSFTVDPRHQGERLVLFFGSVDEDAKIWINGELVADHTMEGPDGWKRPFTIDISDAVSFGESNFLAVAVRDSAGKGGIYKRVWVMKQ
ncbi:MAG: DUF4838 domain-containing protein [Armatimonadota bacterium]|nr:DUF4838 domain-containing protein [Armatimonadota bacterium]